MKRNRILSTVVALAMALSLVTPALAAEELPILISAPVRDAVILYTNDVHTRITEDITYSKLATLKGSIPGALLVDVGDHSQGTVYGAMDNGATVVGLMNAAGYDLATLGNHEFDYGMGGTMQTMDRAEFPYTSCNFYHEKNGVPGDTVLDPYTVLTSNGIRIAFVGITTPESFSKSTPAYFQNEKGEYIYGIAAGTDGAALYAAVQTAIDAAAQEADYVIALGHLGDDPSAAPWRSEDVIANTTGLDAFLDGHSHSTVESKTVTDKGGNSVLLTQTGSYFETVGKLTISPDGTITAQLLTPEELADVTPDETVKAMEDAWVAEIDAQLGQVIGSTDDILDNYDADGNRQVRSQETTTGDFVTDALYHLFDSMDLDVDVAVMNGGGIRNKAVTGAISYLTCKEIHPFGNVACLQTVTGQQLLDALEWGAREVGEAECGGFLQVSGLTYTVNTAIPSTVQMDDKGVWTGGPTGAYRVTDVKVLDRDTNTYQPLDRTAEYNLAGYNYTLRDLGDGFAMFNGAVNVVDYVMDDYLLLAEYIKSFPEGKLTGYSAPQGRITIVSESAAETPAAPEAPSVDAATYVVVPGDCLWAIARRVYGSGSRFGEIAAANSIADPALIYPGQVLTLP